MKKIYKVAGIVAVFIFLTVLSIGIGRSAPITNVVEIVGEGVIDRTVEVRNGERGQGLAYSSDMRTPSLGWYGNSKVNILETLELKEGNETLISVSSVYILDNIYHFTDAKNYDVGARYKISHTGSEEGQNNFYVSNNMSYMTVYKKVSGSGRWFIMRKNATGIIYCDKGDYSGNFTIHFEDKRMERLGKGAAVEDWLVCP
jgi:hypothetical protein